MYGVCVCVHVQQPSICCGSSSRLLKAISIHIQNDAGSNFYVPFSRNIQLFMFLFLVVFVKRNERRYTHTHTFFPFKLKKNFFGLFCLFSKESLTHTEREKNEQKSKCLICTSQSVPKDSSRPVFLFLSLSMSLYVFVFVFFIFVCACHFKMK